MPKTVSEITRAHVVTFYGDDLEQALLVAAGWANAHDDTIMTILDTRIDYDYHDQDDEHPVREQVALTFVYQGCELTGCCDHPVVTW